LPEDDYLEAQVKDYDFESHLIVQGGIYQGRRIAGTLYFIKLHQDVREVTEQGVKQRIERATAIPQESPARAKGKKSLTKREVESLVGAYDLEPLLSAARKDKRIVRDVQRLLYSPDRLMRWRAADALGKISALIAEKDAETISRLLQRLFTSIGDSAASSWGALDAIGEIIGSTPDLFAGYVPPLYQLAGDRALRIEVLRALGKIGKARPDLIRKVAHRFIPFLHETDPETRGYTAILLGNLVTLEATDELKSLCSDTAPVEIYRNGNLEKKTIADLASQALKKM
jgi:hypothetical protein